MYLLVLNLNHGQDIDKLFLYDKIPNELKYESVINKRESTGLKYLSSRQILIPRTLHGGSPETSLGRPLSILFENPGAVPIWCPGNVWNNVHGTS